jgi:hypothetical protein
MSEFMLISCRSILYMYFLSQVLNSYGRTFSYVRLLFGTVCVHVMKAYVGVNV